jgi:hypothetical protein
MPTRPSRQPSNATKMVRLRRTSVKTRNQSSPEEPALNLSNGDSIGDGRHFYTSANPRPIVAMSGHHKSVVSGYCHAQAPR